MLGIEDSRARSSSRCRCLDCAESRTARRVGVLARGTLATQRWQCQGFLAFAAISPSRSGTARNYWRSPLRIGTARNNWRKPVPRHPTLALPGMIGVRGLLATQDWHCQGFLASAAPAPPSVGTANDHWRQPAPQAACPKKGLPRMQERSMRGARREIVRLRS